MAAAQAVERTAAAPAIALDGTPQQGGLLSGRVPAGTERLILTTPGTTPVDVPFTAEGAFLIGFDRDAAKEAGLTARMADGREVEQRLSVAPTPWPLERVDAPLRPGASSTAFAERRAAEQARIAAARALEPSGLQPTGWRMRLRWPIAGRITGRFGAQRIYRGEPGSYHGGTDIAAPEGAPVRAPADGVVTLATPAPFTLEGNLILIDHGAGLESALMHLSSIDVTEGQPVRAGDVVGAVGQTGRATGPHLHWGLRWHGARLDPAAAIALATMSDLSE